MTWNYRIIEHDKAKPAYFAVHEVHYNEKGKIETWTENPIDIVDDSKSEVINGLKNMLNDIKQPVLKESKLEKKLSRVGKNWGQP